MNPHFMLCRKRLHSSYNKNNDSNQQMQIHLLNKRIAYIIIVKVWLRQHQSLTNSIQSDSN